MAKKMLKRNLLTSLVAMALSTSMFVGTTFAWFTDSVTSTNNVIKTGNLDVELYYQSKEATTWTKVGENTNVFMEGALWEPGHTEVVKLKVVNEGTLALKYQLGVNVASETGSINMEGNPFMLSDFIKYGIVADGTYTRESAIAAAEAGNATLLKNAYNSGTTTLLVDDKSTAEVKENEKIVTMVVYMPEEVGNEANYAKGEKVPQINLGINLYATQVANEEDSFGPDYDDEAWVNGMQVFNANDLQSAISAGEDIVVMKDITLTEPIVISAPEVTTYSLRATPAAQVINLNGKTITNNNGYVFENEGGNIVIEGNGTLVGLGIIRSKAGAITIENGNFFASSQWQNGVYQHTLKAENTDVVINGGNFDATVKGQTNAMFNASNNGTITINGGTFKNVAETLAQFDPYIFTYEKNGKVVINGGTFFGGWRFNGETATTEIYGGNFELSYDGQSFHAASTHVVTVYGGNFANGAKFTTDQLDNVCAAGLKAVETAEGYKMVIGTEYNYVANGVLISLDGKTYYVSNENGFKWVEAQNDNFFEGKTVALAANIDFGGKTIAPIRFWQPENKTVFDGQGHTLSNFVIVNNGGNAGLFNGTVNIKNLNVDNATVTGKYVGVLAGNMYGNIENCSVKNSVINGTYWQTGALAGQYNAGNITGCVVENCKINGLSAVGALVGILNETAGERKIENCAIKNCEIKQTASFGGDYDKYFGVAVGLVDIANSTVYFNDCVLENNTLKGVASNALYGEVNAGTIVVIDGVEYVVDAATLQKKINAATGETEINLGANITGDVTITQKEGVELTINGNGYNYNGVITVDGKSARYETAALTIENVNFAATTLSADAFIRLGYVDAARYTNNVTVKDCTFSGNGFVAVKSYTGGDHNVTLKNLTVNEGMHSLAQFANVEQNLKIVDCKVYSKNGVNLNNGLTLAMSGCEFDVQGYAIRFGVNGTVNESQKSFTIENSTLKSACAESDDAVIVFRDSSKYAKLTLTNTALVGAVAYKGVTSATTILVDGLTLTAVSGYANLYTDTAKNFYVYDAEGLKSLNNWFEANKYEHAIWGKTFNIMADIDAAGMTWNSVYLQTPNNNCVGFTLNGNNSTISNLTISGSGMFSGTANGANNDNATIVKDLTFDNATVSGGYHVGIVWGQMHRDIVLDNVHVTNSSVTGTCNVGALIGRNGDELASTITFKNCSVTNTNVTANGNGDPNGASVFLGSALTIETGAKPATIKLAFEGCTQSGNTLTSAAGQVGGGIYACWNVTTNTYNAVNDFTNIN